MSNKSIGLSDDLHEYLLRVGTREPEILRRLRDETAAMPMGQMQIAPEQGAFMALLVELIGARRYLEVGTFTGYSALAVALAMPDGRLTCCDVSREWTDVARRYWDEAGVADRIDLRLGPGIDTLRSLLAEGAENTYDFGFIDADKQGYPAYYEAMLPLLRPGGLLAIDNVFRGGRVVETDPDDEALIATQRLNETVADDERVSVAIVPISDGLTLARKR